MSHMRVQEKQEEKNAFCQIFLSSLLRLFRMQCSSIVIEKFEYYSFALIIFIVNQSVCCSLICLAKLVEHCCGDGKEKLYSYWSDWFCNQRWRLSNVDSHEEEVIVILPPIEGTEAKTDCNSDISDDKNEGLAHRIPRRLLTAPCSTNTFK